MRRTPPLIVSLALCGLALASVAAAPRDRRFFSARLGVGVDAPAAWTMSQHTGYPDIVVVMLHPDGSRISVSVAPTRAADARALVEQSRRGLEAQHLAIARVVPAARGGVQLEARNTERSSELRQVYFVRALGAGKRQAVVLTLVASTAAGTTATTAFDWAVAHLALEVPVGADAAPDGGTAPAGSAAGRTHGEDAR